MKVSPVLAAAACAAVSLLAATPQAMAEKAQGDLLVRGRVLYVEPDESSSLSLGGAGIAGKVDADIGAVPELDFTYFLTDNIGVELILGTTPHEVKAKGTPLGNVDLGEVWLLPPTLSAQYHFNPKGQISPYVGAGLNYTFFYNVDNGGVADVDYTDGFGWSLQAGVDVALKGPWSLNLDVKKIFIDTKATVNAGLANPIRAKVDIDPWVVGIGVGYRF
ncbi:MAG TPA: OmpW family outer membrane protein [Azospirillaceae bacterium]|nr:OmpW family outer membrane protein [Azospirillaceae bacterium]